MRTALSILLVYLSFSYGQKSVYLSYTPGYYLHHSENDQPITAANNYTDSGGLKAGFILPLKGFYHLELSTGYQVASINDPVPGYPCKLSEVSVPVELKLLITSVNMTGYGLGAVFVGTNHIFETQKPLGGTYRDVFNSRGLGVNGFIRYSWQIGSQTFLLTDFTGQYIRGITYQGSDLNFSNYDYNYFELKCAFGIGYRLQKSP
ncbi:MAG: hypothetical protein K9N34_10165 [Candidatus Marinimicrobia bacterium]|nr:hypothetical protein [Candidatus Neomarinimicrobiota bacterium]MCF7840928.1 hypothetical protein [Candidatus Neomarinimicrobiota bacterium]